ncbi:rod shape-determining protein [Streptomyces sp. NPDC001941]|uniref:rod shape-determining protein n=1 Tax=Streptomyces sp. NPDC001941 TaxID=3154659 RepID=UPI0033166399
MLTPDALGRLQRCSIAVDLATDRVRVHLKDGGLLVDVPTTIALHRSHRDALAFGERAEQMVGREPDHIEVVRPIVGGMVVDVDLAQRLLRYAVGGQMRWARLRTPLLRAALALPYDSPPVACRSAVETLYGIGVRRVELVDTLMAAAIGSGLPVQHPEASMIVLTGADTTQIAVLSMGSVVASETVPVGSDAFGRSIAEYFRVRHGVALTQQSVHGLLKVFESEGGAPKFGWEVDGRDLASGLARTVRADPDSVREATTTPLSEVLAGVGEVLRNCAPDLVVDIADRGIMLAGSVTRLPGLDTLLREATGLPVHTAERPDECVARGMGLMIEGKGPDLAVTGGQLLWR